MKNWFLLFGLVLNSAAAQNSKLLSPADVSCANPPNCIENSGLDNMDPPSADEYLYMKSSWYTSHGSPTPGASSVWLWSYGGGGEGIYTCFNFESGKQYKLCIRIRTENPPGSLGYENPDALFYIQATNGQFFIPENPVNQVIAAWHAVDQVETDYTFTFTANNNYNKVWVFPYMLVHAPTPVDQYSMNTFTLKVEEVRPAPTLTVAGNTITVANTPPGGHWEWTPSNLVANANPNGSVVTVTQSCSPAQIIGNFVADCSVCTHYMLEANIGAQAPDLTIEGNTAVCEGETIGLSVTDPNTATYNYQWMQMVNTQPVALANNSIFSGTNTPTLHINTSENMDSGSFYCVAQTINGNCSFNSNTIPIVVFQNPPTPIVTVANPTTIGGSNGSITINAPISNTIIYQLDEGEFVFLPHFENLPAGTYAVSAINGSGCKSTIMVTLTDPTVPVAPNGMIPRGISPNGDGSNDSFDLTGIGSISQVKIFNRYGVNVYSKAHYLNEWKGQTDKGKSLPTATYYYVIFFENGESKTGWVYLQREI
ncbi:gliding motility-associated C-terminal domain-containing protein [Flavobacterium sp.]|uniref:gliding motility-associated C-terminal domain-containing protein n=1 Tax=Flavobacterium sp. TaxID=239 RepID=UPI0039E2DDF7